jgi:hypothetical protein
MSPITRAGSWGTMRGRGLPRPPRPSYQEGYHPMPEKSPSVASSGTVATPRPYERFIEHLAMLAEVDSGISDGDAIAADIMDRMLTSGTLEEAIEVQNAGLPSGKSLIDIEIAITGFVVRKGDVEYEEHSLGYYLRCDAIRMDTGEELTFAVGARNIVTLIVMARQQDKLPLECVFRSRKTQQGALLTLHLLPKRAVNISASK